MINRPRRFGWLVKRVSCVSDRIAQLKTKYALPSKHEVNAQTIVSSLISSSCQPHKVTSQTTGCPTQTTKWHKIMHINLKARKRRGVLWGGGGGWGVAGRGWGRKFKERKKEKRTRIKRNTFFARKNTKRIQNDDRCPLPNEPNEFTSTQQKLVPEADKRSHAVTNLSQSVLID